MSNVTFNVYANGSEVDIRKPAQNCEPLPGLRPGRVAENMTVEFRGLCSFIERRDRGQYEVYLLSGLTQPTKECDPGTIKHLSTLVIPTNAVDPKTDSANVAPKQVINIGGTELGIWPIDDQKVSFSTAGRDLPTWDKSNCIDLNALHKKPIKPSGKIDSDYLYAVILVSGGSLACEDVQTFCYDQDDKTYSIDAAYSVVWTPQNQAPPTILFDKKSRIRLTAPTTIWVTNVAASAAGLEHFSFYYTLIDADIDCDERIKVHPHRMLVNENTYGCTPPTTGS